MQSHTAECGHECDVERIHHGTWPSSPTVRDKTPKRGTQGLEGGFYRQHHQFAERVALIESVVISSDAHNLQVSKRVG